MSRFNWEILPRSEQDLISQLLKNRGIKPSLQDNFLNPKLSDLADPLLLSGVKEAQQRILSAVKNKEKIIIYGDYDVDGVTATAVLWEAINKVGGQVMPYIPDRFTEGYGVTETAIEKMASEGTKLIISVDAGVTAVSQIKKAKSLGVDFIVTDHHLLPEELPDALAIVHTTELAGVGVAYKLAQSLTDKPSLEFVALGTIADIVPLVGENRILAKFGLEELRRTTRPGLLAIYEEAKIDRSQLGTYQVGFIIDPRLNAMGRLEHAIDSLRILLTTDQVRANSLAKKLGDTNRERIKKTLEMIEHARGSVGDSKKEKLWVVSDSSYEQGIIGLIAGRLADEWGRPVIAIAEGESLSNGSARSIPDVNIVEAIAQAKDILINYGGHPQAAGFTIETKNIPMFRKLVQEYVQKKVDDEDLRSKFIIDCEIRRDEITVETARKIRELAPFGVGNKEPLFKASNLEVNSMRLLSENKHLKLSLDGIDAIGFGLGSRGAEIRPNMKIDAVFHLEENVWMGRSSAQLKLRDFEVKS